MSKLEIYGPNGGRTVRAIWAAQEAGVDYELKTIAPEDKDAYRAAINPNGNFPAIKDGDMKLFESLAITQYIAKKYGKGKLNPATVEGEAQANQWSLWALLSFEASLIAVLMQRVWRPEADRDAAAAAEAEAKLQGPLGILEAQLSKSDYLLGDSFTVADLNVSAILSFAGKGGVDLSAYPKTLAWMKKIHARPAAAALAAAWPI